MPGRTPQEAFSAFVDPLGEALKCVATAKILHSAGGTVRLGVEHALMITGNDNDGYTKLRSLPDKRKLEFMARMRYLIIEDEREGYGPYRITTRAYDYAIQTQDKALVIAWHWHPSGNSHVTEPHLHLGSSQLSADSVLSEKAHYPTGRITFEAAIAASIQLGAKPNYEDWREILAMCEGPHIQYRSWHKDYERETGQKIS